MPPEQAQALAEFHRYFETTVSQRLLSLGPTELRGTARFHSKVLHGKPYVEILRLEADTKPDLIVMGVRGRHATDLTLFGSTTHQVVRRAMCPVLTICDRDGGRNAGGEGES